jgi:acyl homoserine lactone synthase
MIEIVQPGQAGKTKYLFDMHRLRARVFKERMKWDVSVSEDGLEVDDFDLPETIYLLALNDAGRVIGNWRLLPSTGPTMIRDVWPDFLETLPMPSDARIWEASRFAVHSPEDDPRAYLKQVNRATAEMFCALTELCLICGIREIYTLYDHKIARLLKRLDCQPAGLSEQIPIDDIPVQIGRFVTNQTMLERLRAATGIQTQLIDPQDLPPGLEVYVLNHLKNTRKREVIHA